MIAQKYKDPEGNVYAVEKSVKTGRFIVIRTNPGGNRKLAATFAGVCGNSHYVQARLDDKAKTMGWTPTP